MITLVNKARLLQWEIRPYSLSGHYRGFLWVLVSTEHKPEHRHYKNKREYAHIIQMWYHNRPIKKTMFFTNKANPQQVVERKINSYLDKNVPIHYDR